MKYMYGWLQVARGDVAPAEAHAAIDREAAEAGPAEASGDTSLSDYKGGGVAEAQCLVSSSLHLPPPLPFHPLSRIYTRPNTCNVHDDVHAYIAYTIGCT